MTPDDVDVFDFVLEPVRPARLRTALVAARGIGGFNSAIVLRAVAEQA